MLSIFVVGALISLVGCSNCNFTHGICDCQVDDYCTSRSPWLRYNSTPTDVVETIPAPATPEIRKGL